MRCWGSGGFGGALGLIGYGNADGMGDNGGAVLALEAGNAHTCALLENRQLGQGEYG